MKNAFSRIIAFFSLFLIVSVFFVAQTFALNFDSSPPANYASCSVEGLTWVNGVNGDNCSPGYLPNLTACSGQTPARQPCGAGEFRCNLACIREVDPELEIPRGGSCVEQPANCEFGTSCVGGRCLVSGTVPENFQCFANSECKTGTPDQPNEIMSCSGNPGVCRGMANCSTDAECVTLTNDPSAICRVETGRCITPPPVGEPLPAFDYCAQVPEAQQEACLTCIAEGGTDDDGNPQGTLYTAVGCIQTDEQGLAADLIRLLLGLAGGVALLSILAGAFIFSTSQGESNRVKQAKELITAAVSGLLFIIFVVIILDFIGVKILQIPGLG